MTVLPAMLLLAKLRIPPAWSGLNGLGPLLVPVYSLPLIVVLPTVVAVAPGPIWMPFWAIYGVGPTPVIVVSVMVPVEPLLPTMIPTFW